MTIRSPLDPVADLNACHKLNWSGLTGSAAALAISTISLEQDSITTVLTANAWEAEMMAESLKFYTDGVNNFPVMLFSGWECLPYDTFSPYQEILSQRIRLLSILPNLTRGLLVVAVDTLMQRLPPTDFIESNSFSFETGAELHIGKFRERMAQISYRNVQQVESPGEFVVRGGVIDLFAMGSDAPIRIELFGNEIETLRYFDPDTQLTTRKINQFEILPGSEICLTDDSIRLFRKGIRQHIDGDPRRNLIYRDIDSEEIPNGAEFYLPLFFSQTSNLLDYLRNPGVLFLSEYINQGIEQFWQQVNERYKFASELTERPPLSPDLLYYAPENLQGILNTHSTVRIETTKQANSIQFNTTEPIELSIQDRSERSLSQLKDIVTSSSKRTLICADSEGKEQIVQSLLNEIEITVSEVASWHQFIHSSEKVALCVSNLPVGLHLPDQGLRVLASPEIFGSRSAPERKVLKTQNPEALISSMEDLQIDDLVVHESYGVGLYKGLVTLDVSGTNEEFLSIRYRDEQTLYVPVYAIDTLSRYIGNQPSEVALNDLGSARWNKSKAKAKEQAYDLAAELLNVQVMRETRQGNAMPVPDSDYQQLVSQFPYQETPDQRQAIQAVLGDLNSSRPMDRLVCGDVGFGKTEVAIRAALVAVANRYQVAIVVPTTVLASQHFNVFQERLIGFGIAVRLHTRMANTKQAKQNVAELKSGIVDIVIGTHRLLQSEIEFSNLGLVIIDEEHRFGVRQKEFLKKQRAEVDILTMTATPIPRTLSMVLNEMRDISIIATPPNNRLSIRTFVRNWQADIVREACLRELKRGGQIFYVHNEVRSIISVAKEIERIVPEARIVVAHGQMSKLKLQSVMQSFYLHKYDLLVCTTIIESGIDIPTANTIIIDKASKFGLAQLHQLRGRVGRSHHQAYAYLLVPSTEYLNSDARRRLEAIATFDQLGMGYVIATHDLEIRGAGALLGDEQSGVINEIGYSMYSEILKDAVDTIKKTQSKTTNGSTTFKRRFSAEINLNLSALLPESWIPNVNLRLKLYRQIASAEKDGELNRIKSEMLDRFGKLPEQVDHLFHVHTLKHLCERIGISKLTIGPKYGKLLFREDTAVSLAGLNLLVNEYEGRAKLNPTDSSLQLSHSLNSKDDRIRAAYRILNQLTPQELEVA